MKPSLLKTAPRHQVEGPATSWDGSSRLAHRAVLSCVPPLIELQHEIDRQDGLGSVVAAATRLADLDVLEGEKLVEQTQPVLAEGAGTIKCEGTTLPGGVLRFLILNCRDPRVKAFIWSAKK